MKLIDKLLNEQPLSVRMRSRKAVAALKWKSIYKRYGATNEAKVAEIYSILYLEWAEKNRQTEMELN